MFKKLLDPFFFSSHFFSEIGKAWRIRKEKRSNKKREALIELMVRNGFVPFCFFFFFGILFPRFFLTSVKWVWGVVKVPFLIVLCE